MAARAEGAWPLGMPWELMGLLRLGLLLDTTLGLLLDTKGRTSFGLHEI